MFLLDLNVTLQVSYIQARHIDKITANVVYAGI